MTEVLGVPMLAIMIVLLAMLAAIVGVMAWLWTRNRILVDIGLRNIRRRKAQSLLIVLGLMLSTVIIAAALATGDTVNYSITNDAYSKLGHVDEIVQVRENTAAPSLTGEQVLPAGLVPQPVIDTVVAEFRSSDIVDGTLPGLRFPAPVKNEQDGRVDPDVVIIGLESGKLAGFEDDIVTTDGRRFDISTLGRTNIGETTALANESAARELGLKVGDKASIYIGQLPRQVTITGIVKDRFLTGWTRDVPEGIVVSKATVQFLFSVVAPPRGAGFIAISNQGGVRDSVGLSDEVQKEARGAVNTGQFDVKTVKQDRVDRAKEIGSNMAAIFVVLGLFTIAAGLLLIFLILVTLAAERRTEMGMSRAVGMKRAQLVEAFMAEGLAYSLTSAAIGAALGVAVSIGMTYAMRYIFQRFDVAIVFHVTAESLVVAYCVGVVLTFATVTASAWRVSRLSVVAAIRETNETALPPTALRSAGIAAIVLAAGGILAGLGLQGSEAWAFGAGASLLLIGAAFAGRAAGLGERALFSGTSVAVIVLWVLLAGGNLHALTGTLDLGIETFFVGGVLMVAAATFLVIFNAEFLLGALRVVGIVFGRAIPAVRTATAYPLANKSRTGMTIAMLSLVVFALVMISTMSMNFRNLFLNSDARGGWDIEISALPTNLFPSDAQGNRLGALGEALDRKFYDTPKIASISQVGVVNERGTQIAQPAPGQLPNPRPFRILGADDTFLDENEIGLQARAEGYATDRDVWEAVKNDPANAVIDGSAVAGINYANVTQSRFTLRDYESGDTSFAPFNVQISNTAGDVVQTVRIIGIMDRAPSDTYSGIWLRQSALGDSFPVLFSRYYIRLRPGEDAAAEASKIEQALAENGVSAHSIAQQVEDDQSLNTSFFYLVQGFMALGLGVGLAALGVIALRTVVERRQQIGLMRAIGFSRTNVALTFLLESMFIAVLGIVNGIWPALLLANRLLASDEFASAGFNTFYVPWMQILLMTGLVFIAAVLTTLIPSRQASNIPPAAALRYE
jgi:putative ABC transport system permease protein